MDSTKAKLSVDEIVPCVKVGSPFYVQLVGTIGMVYLAIFKEVETSLLTLKWNLHLNFLNLEIK